MRIILTVIFLSLFSFGLQAQQVYEHQFLVKIGDKAPNFEVRLNNGSTFKLSEQRGKIVMLQFTASWCSVCRKEMPFIEKDIWAPLKGKDFVLVGMDYKEQQDRVDAFAKQMDITYPLGIDSTGSAFYLFAQEGSGVTRNVIIDKEGKIIYLTRLFNTEEFEKMKAVIFNAVE
jgi:peroxiredoxin